MVGMYIPVYAPSVPLRVHPVHQPTLLRCTGNPPRSPLTALTLTLAERKVRKDGVTDPCVTVTRFTVGCYTDTRFTVGPRSVRFPKESPRVKSTSAQSGPLSSHPFHCRTHVSYVAGFTLSVRNEGIRRLYPRVRGPPSTTRFTVGR